MPQADDPKQKDYEHQTVSRFNDEHSCDQQMKWKPFFPYILDMALKISL